MDGEQHELKVKHVDEVEEAEKNSEYLLTIYVQGVKNKSIKWHEGVSKAVEVQEFIMTRSRRLGSKK